ncbi:MAG: DUF2961 domain-containing protein [Spirochaetales bacterium]|nr:DUF2961 domain-containing protein [Spirochaetales bacterium]
MLHDLIQTQAGESRSISAENRTGEKAGGGRDMPEFDVDQYSPAEHLGQGWKCHPFDFINPGETYVMADIEGPGCINHIWLTATGLYRSLILRVYYDDNPNPAIETPLADFFASAYTDFRVFAQIDSIPVSVNPGNAFNSYWKMPFKKRMKMTLENRNFERSALYYQVDYELKDLPENTAYFHAQFRRVHSMTPGEAYVVLDGVEGDGHYVGTYMAWQMNSNKWWGEGEMKFYLDGDAHPDVSDGKVVGGSTGFPTICTTGTEDYFLGSHNFENKVEQKYQEYTTAYAGVPHIVRPDGLYNANLRFSMYRWHIEDPIRFHKDIKVTCQALGWRKNAKFLPLRDDIASVAFWYQSTPTQPFPPLGSDEELELC